MSKTARDNEGSERAGKSQHYNDGVNSALREIDVLKCENRKRSKNIFLSKPSASVQYFSLEIGQSGTVFKKFQSPTLKLFGSFLV